jgi:hypothetical protein
MTFTIRVALGVALVGALAVHSVDAQTPDRAKTLRAAAEALGMDRWSDIGSAANTRLPGIDIVNTQELIASGMTDVGGRMVKTDVHVALGYNPAAMRVELTPEGGAAQLGGGLVPGKGTATPAMAAVRERLLRLWTLPFGVVKAAYAGGDKTVVSTEGGATVITAPLGGPLAGMSVRATLDAKSLITKVEARADNPALANLASEATQMEYSDYADHAEVLTDIKTPGHIVGKRDGRTVFDLTVKSWENNPYVVFPVPPNVKAASAASPTSR